jgi:hypothetical protein
MTFTAETETFPADQGKPVGCEPKKLIVVRLLLRSNAVPLIVPTNAGIVIEVNFVD